METFDGAWPYDHRAKFDGKPPNYSGAMGVNSGGMWWPYGNRHFSNAALGEHLHTSARHHARRAVMQYASDEADEQMDAAISVGVAYELMLKAHLSDVAYSLLAAAGDRDSLLMLSGKGSLAQVHGTGFRSAQIKEAAGAAKQLTPSLPIPRNHQDILPMKVRNSACHMALVEALELRQAVIDLVRLVDGMLTAGSSDRVSFWGESAFPVAEALLDEATTALEQQILAKVAAAQERLAAFRRDLGFEQRQVVFGPRTVARGGVTDYASLWDCPACEQKGDLLCDFEEPEIEDRQAEEGYIISRTRAYPFSFRCPVCGLSLNEEEVKQTESLPDFIPVEYRFTEEWEPDEDIERGR